MEEKTYNYDSFVIYTVKTDKFKNGYIEVNFRDDIRNVDVPKRNMLTNLMRYSTLKYPSNKELKIAQENLYDLSFTSATSRVGYNIISSFSMDFLHPKYVNEKDYLKQCLSFFFECLLKPDIKNDAWNPQSFEIIFELLISNIDIYKENPTSYAVIESRKRLFKDSISGKRIIGTQEEIKKLDEKALASDYQNMFQNSICEMVLVGDFNMDEMAKMINSLFYKPSIVEKQIPNIIEQKQISYYEEEEKRNYKQTQIMQYYLLDSLTTKEKKFVVPLFRQILGTGALCDKLGYYLRTKNSLCYTYFSSFSLSDSYLLLSTAIKEKNIKKALQCFDRVMLEMKKGNIDAEDLENKKLKVITNAKFQLDSIYGIAENCYNSNVFQTTSINEYLSEIPKVTIKDLKVLSSKMHKCYTYILKEGEADGRD